MPWERPYWTIFKVFSSDNSLRDRLISALGLTGDVHGLLSEVVPEGRVSTYEKSWHLVRFFPGGEIGGESILLMERGHNPVAIMLCGSDAERS